MPGGGLERLGSGPIDFSLEACFTRRNETVLVVTSVTWRFESNWFLHKSNLRQIAVLRGGVRISDLL